MKKELYIWGAGTWGELAYCYYKEESKVLGYIDSAPEKWGTLKNGIEVYPPKVLREKEVMVVIAVKQNENIERVLKEIYKIKEISYFGIYEKTIKKIEVPDSKEILLSDASIIIFFGGGLGNQMFQYALLRNYSIMNKNVYADLDDYLLPKKGIFELTKVFQNIKLEICSTNQKCELLKRYANGEVQNKFIIENKDKNEIDKKLLEIDAGIIKGLHQNYYFASLVRKELLKDFEFNLNADNQLKKWCEKFENSKNIVSVHVRRGDYLSPKYYSALGDVCTEQYYMQAMEFMERQIENCRFCFFSDDILWVKNHYLKENAMYIDSGMFDKYQNWYDMCLMSFCSHNIIANSTFSWWGAWLNKNVDKIVIAPKKWSKTYEFPDICPPNWIRM